MSISLGGNFLKNFAFFSENNLYHGKNMVEILRGKCYNIYYHDKNHIKYGLTHGGYMMERTSKPCGRPSGRTKTAKIEVTIEPEIKDEFMDLLSAQGKKASVEIGAWIREYIKESKRGQIQ